MENRANRPTSLADFKGKLPFVTVTRQPDDPGDLEATRSLIQLYTHEDGFHCPRCPFITSDPDEAVNHLAEEINKALEGLARRGR